MFNVRAHQRAIVHSQSYLGYKTFKDLLSLKCVRLDSNQLILSETDLQSAVPLQLYR